MADKSNLTSPSPSSLSSAQNNQHAQPTHQVIDAIPLSQIPLSANFQVQYFDGPEFGLPERWQVEYRPRKSAKYIGKVDQFYYEPDTCKQFRSMKSVKEYLGLPVNVGKKTSGAQPMQPSDSEAPQGSRSRTSTNSKRKRNAPLNFDYGNAPESITWVLNDADYDIWWPYLSIIRIPDHLKEHWKETFMSIMMDAEDNSP